MDDIKNIPPMNFGKGILKEILKAIEEIKKKDETPIVKKIEGPFTICEFIMSTNLFYKAILTKDPTIVDFSSK